MDKRTKTRLIAAALSFVIPGLGQIYDKRFFRGIAFLASFLISVALVPYGVGEFIVPLVSLVAVIEAYWGKPAKQDSVVGTSG